MQNVNSDFVQQKKEFITRTQERLATMFEITQHLGRNTQDYNALRELGKNFHQLIGASAAFQFERLGDIAVHGEKLCLDILQSQRTVGRNDLKNFSDMLDTMHDAIVPPAPPAPSTTPNSFLNRVNDTGNQAKRSSVTSFLTQSGYDQPVFTKYGPGYGSEEPGPANQPLNSPGGNNWDSNPPASLGFATGAPQTSSPRVRPSLDQPQQPLQQGFSVGPPGGAGSTWKSGQGGRPGSSEFQTDTGFGAQPKQQQFQQASSEFGMNREKPKDILIVDGDQQNLHVLTGMLEEAGMQVRGYRTASGGKQALHERLPDALILSIPLVDGPGYDVAQELRQLPDGGVPPILILSRQIGFLDKVTAIRCGADAFFDDISDPQSILRKLNHLLDRDKPGNYTILSVEDDPDQAVYIRAVLESAGYTVESIQDPRQFEDALLAINPDLLLLDVMLGPVSGFELARFVRQDDRYAATPIIFLTTQNQLNAHVESARVGGDEHLIKPVAPPLLIAAVSGRLERYRTLKKLIGRDALTNCLTLSAFMEEAEKLISKRSSHSIGPMVLLLIDVDHTEQINDQMGFSAGDKAISALSQMLRKTIRNAEVIARTDGDEFAVVVANIDDRELSEVATQIIRDFENTDHSVRGRRFRATVSAGAAALDHDMTLKEWIGNARLALKSAKEQGRNRVLKAKSRKSADW